LAILVSLVRFGVVWVYFYVSIFVALFYAFTLYAFQMAKSFSGAPQFVKYFGPVLDALHQLGGSGRPDEVRSLIAQKLGLSEQEQSEPLPSKAQPRFDNQVHWARFYLSKGGFLDSSTRGVWALTDKGRSALPLNETAARTVFRDVSSIFAKSKAGKSQVAGVKAGEEEIIPGADAAVIQQTYREEIAAKLQSLSPGGFERFCQRLLRESGFQEVTITGRSGDGGIDGIGILQVNSLVSFKVLFQCKKYQGSVSPMQVRDFRGAMMGRADKGIIITTGSFTAEARKEAVRDGVPPIELVDGEKLVAMLEQLELGLKPRTIYEIDSGFFDSFQ
jgi:restriction system protein